MNRFLLVLIACTFNSALKAQLVADHLSFDFGNIEHFNNDTAYFTFTNTGSRTIYLLQTQPKDDYAILCDTKTIEAGEQMRIGIVYYTGEKGRFSLTVPLYFSHLTTAMELNIRGNIRSITETAFTTCPSIENTSPLKPGQSPLSIVVKDAETSTRLTDAHVKISRKNISFNCVPGFADMAYQCKCDYGRLQVTAEKKGYLTENMMFDYDAVNNTCTIYLTKNNVQAWKDSLPATPANIRDTIEEPMVYIPAGLADSGFNSSRYKPNHLIFIIDISKSMKDSSKLYYLKQAVRELVKEIRPQDYITLITYAYKVKVVFENVSGRYKNDILMAIDTLSANGGSNGAKSIIMAYEIANRHYIAGGNNQIFLATDGLFNSNSLGEEDLYKIVRKEYARNKVILSTIGFGKDAKSLAFLDKLAKNGRGNFLSIAILPEDIRILLEEVKKQSASR